MLAVDGVYPDRENISSGSYPVTMDFYAVYRADNSNENVPKVIEWILSDEGQRLIEESGYSRLIINLLAKQYNSLLIINYFKEVFFMKNIPVIKDMVEDIVKICDPLQIFLVSAKKNSKGEITRFKLCIVAWSASLMGIWIWSSAPAGSGRTGTRAIPPSAC